MNDEINTRDESTSATLTIPEDAKTGDYFVVICQVKDQADAPITRYAEFTIEIA